MVSKINVLFVLLFLSSCAGKENKSNKENDLPKAPQARFIIKAYNMQYLTLEWDTAIVANQPNPEKAEMFEKIDLGNGKSALRASNMKYVSDDRTKGRLCVNKDSIGDCETFEIIAMDRLSVRIKSSAGKFVCSDPEPGKKLTADRDVAASWETFIFEER